MKLSKRVLALVVAVGGVFAANAESIVYEKADGKLGYTADERGNTIPDFSRAGYMGGGVKLPEVEVRLELEPKTGDKDDTARIQKALDKVCRLKPDKSGFRGALLLKKGLFRVNGTLYIKASGVVLRGEGQGDNGTVVLGTGTEKRDLISVGEKLEITEIPGSRRKIADAYVPWSSHSFSVKSTKGYSVGDQVIVYRPSTKKWIRDLGMDRIVERRGTKQWKAGEYDLHFERTITAINGKKITLDAPVMNALEEQYGGGYIYRYKQKGRLQQVGIESLRLVSEYEKGNKEDEKHAWRGVGLEAVSNSWVRNLTTVHFSHCVTIQKDSIFVTVQDSACIDPISIIRGGRRYPFAINGQYSLVQRCYSRDPRHAQATGSRVRGPNAFLDCLTEKPHNDIGPHHRWAIGTLWDNLKGGQMRVQDRGNLGSGHGWAGAQQVFWNCKAWQLCVQQPPTAQNYAIGCTGKTYGGRFKDRPWGYFESHGKHVKPRSLYLSQLKDRLGEAAVANISTEEQRKGPIYQKLKEQLSH